MIYSSANQNTRDFVHRFDLKKCKYNLIKSFSFLKDSYTRKIKIQNF